MKALKFQSSQDNNRRNLICSICSLLYSLTFTISVKHVFCQWDNDLFQFNALLY